LSYLVAERTREIGVRMALGARSEQVSRMVMRQGARVVGIGVVVGLVAAVLSTRALGTLLYEVRAIDPLTFAVAAVLMIVIGLLASYMPARRASQVDPMVSLRAE
jgi:putative ABC transport system permease protein